MYDIDSVQDWIKLNKENSSLILENKTPYDIITDLAEKTGDIAKSVRKVELYRQRKLDKTITEKEVMDGLLEEIGDALATIMDVASKYDIKISRSFENYKNKTRKKTK